jgi:DNA ligase-associated metallophosphoesterase
LGKTGHFRKAGIAIPPMVFKEDLQRLWQQILFFNPKTLLITGDFSHSYNNKELELFARWRNELSSTEVILVKGNHDILEEDWYRNTDIRIYSWQLTVNDFSFVHHPEEQPNSNYTFCGHVHPAVRITGAGKQSLSFPCFYFGKKQCILPAFSKFSGYSLIEKRKGEDVFAIVNKELIQL